MFLFFVFWCVYVWSEADEAVAVRRRGRLGCGSSVSSAEDVVVVHPGHVHLGDVDLVADECEVGVHLLEVFLGTGEVLFEQGDGFFKGVFYHDVGL